MSPHSLPRRFLAAVFALALLGMFSAAQAQDAFQSEDGSAEITHQPTGEAQRSVIALPTQAVVSDRLQEVGYRGGGELLYSGGPFVTCTDCMGEGEGLGDGSVLESQTLGMNTLGFNQNFGNFVLAQPFTVPAGGWTIDAVETFAYDTGSTLTSTQTGVYIQIWDGHPGDEDSNIVYGDTTNVMTNTEWSGVYRYSESNQNTDRPIMVQTATLNATLDAGDYFIAWAGSTSGGTSWAPPVAVPGVCATGQAYGYSVANDVWERREDSGDGACVQSLPINIFGAGAPSPAFTPSTTLLAAGFLADGSPDLRAGNPVQELSIRTLSGPDFDWDITVGDVDCEPTTLPWLSVTPTSGTTAAGEASDVTVTFDPTGLGVGTYEGSLCIDGNAPSDAVTVRMTILQDEEMLLLIPSSTVAERAMNIFDYHFGNLIYEGFGSYGSVFTAVPWGLSVNFDGDGYYMATGQVGASARIHEFDGMGAYVGEFAIPGGTTRGIKMTPDGQHLAAAVQTLEHENSIILLDDEGDFASYLVPSSAGGLNNPADFVIRENDILVIATGNNAILRYDLAGEFLDIFYQWDGSITPGQMIQAANGNIIATITSLIASRGWYEFEPDGTLLNHFNPDLVSPMGVHELPTGNLLVSNSNGVRELDRATGEVVATHRDTGSNRWILAVPEDMITLPPVATFSPEDGLDVSVHAGESTVESFAIGNIGDSDLDFGPITAHAAANPALDEDLTIPTFTLTGTGDENPDANHTATVAGGITTQGAVDGLSFEGTVEGVSGTSAWASDMRLTVTSPDNQEVTFGSGGTHAWDFTGTVSTDDGTYSSEHQGVFTGAQDAGDWTFHFLKTFGAATSMTWSDVTITLHKEGEDFVVNISPDAGTVAADGSVTVDVTFDADGFLPGVYPGYLSIPTNEPANRPWWSPEEFEAFDEERQTALLAELGVGRQSDTAHTYPITMEVTPAPGDPPIAGFSPPSLEVPLAIGESSVETITVSNTGGSDLEFDFTEFSNDVLARKLLRDQHDPGLDENLDVPDFTVISPANEGEPVSFTIPGGIATSGTVVGFTFVGTVSGLAGNSSWASDLRMVITSPTGESFDVGGLTGRVNDWEFQGGGSTGDGTYTSTHFGAFGDDGISDAGDWELEFVNGWDSASAADMDWTDVTVTLHKIDGAEPPTESFITDVSPASGTVEPGSSIEVSVTFDAAGFEPGTFEDELTIATNEAGFLRGLTQDEFGQLPSERREALLAQSRGGVVHQYPVTMVIDAEPVATFDPSIEDGIERTLDSGDTTTATLTIGNTGIGDLNFEFAGFRDAHTPALDEEFELDGFTLLGSGSTDTQTAIGGVATQGQVVGFTFEGMVELTGGSFATDMSLTITSPDDQTYAVGGFGTGNPAWGFPGSGSGPREATFIGVFDDATDVGEWTFHFENHFGTDAQMAWSDVTITLHKGQMPIVTGVDPAAGSLAPGATVDITIDISAAGLNQGSYTSFLEILTNEPDNLMARAMAGELGRLDTERLEAIAQLPVRQSTTHLYPITLNVIGEAGCFIEPDPIAFDAVIVGFDATLSASVSNAGTAECEFTAVSIDEDDFTTDLEPITLAPGQSEDFEVTFAPSSTGSISGTLTLSNGNGDVTAALSGTGLAPPVADVAPTSLVFHLNPDEPEDTQTLTLSNTAAEGAADLEFSVGVAQARPEARPEGGYAMTGVLEATRGSAARGSSPAVDFVSETGIQPGTGLPQVSYAGGRGGIDCDLEPGIIIQDDGTAENGYSGNAATVPMMTLVDRFTPSDYPATFTDVCIAFLSQAPPTLDYELVVLAADGPDGQPGTELGSVQATATDIPVIAGAPYPVVWQTVDLSELELFVEEGDVYIGARYAPLATGQNVFVTADQSTDRPVGYAGGYFGVHSGSGIEWNRLGFDAFELYRAQFIRPVEAPAITTVTVEPDEGTVAAGATQELLVTAEMGDLEDGSYDFELLIQTNDPENPVLAVDVTVNVGPVSSDPTATPLEFALAQNYPNPFAASTTIEFALPEAGAVTIEVFDLAGRLVTTLVDGEMEAGHHSTTWNANGVASGVYLYRIQAGSFSQTLRALVVR